MPMSNLERLIMPSKATSGASESSVSGSLYKVAAQSGGRVGEAMKLAAQYIEQLGEENKTLKKEAKIRTMVDKMVDTGVISSSDYIKKVAELQGKSDRDLEVIAEASKMASMSSFGLFSGESGDHVTRDKEMFNNCLIN